MSIFDNTQIAFQAKTDAQLDRAYFLFKMIASAPMVKVGTLAAQFALKSNLPVEGLIRATVFDHFCSGTSAEESLPVINQLAESNVFSILDYSVEGAKSEINLDTCLSNTLKTLALSKTHKHVPFSVFKPTGFGDFDLYEKVSNKTPLNEEEKVAWGRIRKRFHECCAYASDAGVQILIDAEESWIQPAVNLLVEEMMATYNKERVVVYTTAQMYLKDKFAYLQELIEKAEANGFYLGVKLVRGAYMEKEAARAEARGYENPICPSKEATDENFNNALRFLIDHVARCSIYCGSHNEASTQLFMDLIQAKQLPKNHPHLWFGQLYGMSDHISFNLAEIGYNTSKYLPFGPVKDVLPYLIRRAEENTSVAGQTHRELALIKKERERRRLTDQ